jgi:hypothetical protein
MFGIEKDFQNLMEQVYGPLNKDKMTDIEKTKAEIKVLEKKLALLEEIEKQPRMNLQGEGEYAVVLYHDKVYYRLENKNTFSWYIKKDVSDYHIHYRSPNLVMVEDAETERLLEGLYYNYIQVKKEKEQRTKTPVEECYKDWWGEYPELETDSQYDDTRWQGFQAGYEFAYAISTAKEVMEKVQEEQEDNEWKSVALKLGENLSDNGPNGYYEFSPDEWFEWVIDECLTNEVKRLQKKEWNVSVKWCGENPDKDPLDCLKPQTPEQTAQSLKEAFVKAQQTENWKETQKLIDEEDNDKNFKNSLDLIKEWGEKNKPPTLKELLWEWWEDIFTVDADLDADASIDVLVDRIDKEFIPPSSEKNGYEWEKCLKIMREKLR